MDKQQRQKHDMWALSIDVWKKAACVTKALQEAINGLRDADGDPLPDSAKRFFTDVLFLDAKCPRQTKHYLPTEAIREQYRILLFFERRAREMSPNISLLGAPPPSCIAKEKLADMYHINVHTVDQIVSPRRSRLPQKPRNY